MRFRFLSFALSVLLVVSSCASVSTEEETSEDVIAEKPSPVIIIADEPAMTEEPETKEETAAEDSEIEAVPEEAPWLFSIENIVTRQQSLDIAVSLPAGADPSLLSVTGGGNVSSIRVTGNEAVITITGLESLSEYVFTVCYGGEAVTDPAGAETLSFAGDYRWTPADGEPEDAFVVSVTEAPQGSDYRYYIYLDPEDSAFPEEYGPGEIRIAPLVDRGEPSLDGMKYKDAPEAYKWNNYKWNTGSMTPSRIEYVRAEETESGDEIRTLVASVALGFTAEADVRFVFHEKDGNEYLSFHNRMTPGIANSFLKKNPSPGIRPYETDEYWYTLEKE